jgi:transposase
MDLAKLHLHWRESQYQGKTYRSYSLARAYREDGKNRKEIVVKLGKLPDREANRWRDILQTIKNPAVFMTTADDLVVMDRYSYLDVSVVHAVWDEWGLDDVFKHNGRKDIDVAAIARILTVNRCLDPLAKSRTPEWFRGTALPWIMDVHPDSVNPSRIFRELEVIESHKESICGHLYRKLCLENPEAMRSVFYDLSSATFSGSHCVLMKWGRCKEGYDNHVVLALVVNRDGVPFYWEVLSGGTADAKTISWLLDRFQERFDVSKMTLVFDRGMVSDDNLLLLEQAGVKYISAMDKSQLEKISGIDFQQFSAIDPDHADEGLPLFTKLNDTTYYLEVSENSDRRRYILCFNPQLFRDQRQARRQAIKDQAVDTYQATIVRDDKGLQKAGRLDGFWLLVTNHTEQVGGEYKLSPRDAIAPYRDKVVIESAFRDIKSFIEVAPMYVWTAEHVRAHFTVCVLSYLINRTLTLRLHRHPGRATRDVITHEELYQTLSKCQIDHIKVKNIGIETCNLTYQTEDQTELLGRVGLTMTRQNEVLHKARAVLNA